MLHEKLIQLRKQAGYTQQHLSQILGIPRPTYANYERPKEQSGREPNVEMLKRLADIYDISLDYLLNRTSDPLPKSLKSGINMKQLLKRSLHWDGVPLSEKEIKPITDLLEIVVRERLHRMVKEQDQNDSEILEKPKPQNDILS